MKVAVIGANGQLGTELCAELDRAGHQVCALTRRHIEITDLGSVRTVMTSLNPDLVINTAALHQLEACEQSPQTAYAVNAVGPQALALYSRDTGSAVMHVSTDQVFDGRKNAPYDERDLPCPSNVYGNTKLAGEFMTRATTSKHFVVRTSALYGKHLCRGKGPDLVQRTLELARTRSEITIVDDAVFAPTCARDLARQMVRLAGTDAYGLYHASSEGSCTWSEFAREILDCAGIDVTVRVVEREDGSEETPRPRYSVLANRHLTEAGLNLLEPWTVALREYIGVRTPEMIC